MWLEIFFFFSIKFDEKLLLITKLEEDQMLFQFLTWK